MSGGGEVYKHGVALQIISPTGSFGAPPFMYTPCVSVTVEVAPSVSGKFDPLRGVSNTVYIYPGGSPSLGVCTVKALNENLGVSVNNNGLIPRTSRISMVGNQLL